MFLLKPFRNLLSARLHRQVIAVVQIVVMLALMAPVCFDNVAAAAQDETGVSMTVDSHGADECPCCPADDATTDNCSMCSYCSSHVPLAYDVKLPSYAPSVTPLVALDTFTRLPDVHIPIFIPPRLFA